MVSSSTVLLESAFHVLVSWFAMIAEVLPGVDGLGPVAAVVLATALAETVRAQQAAVDVPNGLFPCCGGLPLLHEWAPPSQ